MTDDRKTPGEESDNILKFPRSVAELEAMLHSKDLPPGAFMDLLVTSFAKPVAALSDPSLIKLLYDFQQYRALATLMIDLMEIEMEHRDLRG